MKLKYLFSAVLFLAHIAFVNAQGSTPYALKLLINDLEPGKVTHYDVPGEEYSLIVETQRGVIKSIDKVDKNGRKTPFSLVSSNECGTHYEAENGQLTISYLGDCSVEARKYWRARYKFRIAVAKA